LREQEGPEALAPRKTADPPQSTSVQGRAESERVRVRITSKELAKLARNVCNANCPLNSAFV
jgi:hypothetical protein